MAQRYESKEHEVRKHYTAVVKIEEVTKPVMTPPIAAAAGISPKDVTECVQFVVRGSSLEEVRDRVHSMLDAAVPHNVLNGDLFPEGMQVIDTPNGPQYRLPKKANPE